MMYRTAISRLCTPHVAASASQESCHLRVPYRYVFSSSSSASKTKEREFTKPFVSLRLRTYAATTFRIMLYVAPVVAFLAWQRQRVKRRNEALRPGHPVDNFEYLLAMFKGELKEEDKGFINPFEGFGTAADLKRELTKVDDGLKEMWEDLKAVGISAWQKDDKDVQLNDDVERPGSK